MSIDEHEMHNQIIEALERLLPRLEIQTENHFVTRVDHFKPEILDFLATSKGRGNTYNEWRFDRYRIGIFDLLIWGGDPLINTFGCCENHWTVQINPFCRDVLAQLKKMGRCWNDQEEYEDWLLIHEAMNANA